MNRALHTTATVQAGRRIQVDVPELTEGQSVDVFVVPANVEPAASTQNTSGIADYLRSLPATQRSDEEWRQLDKAFIKDRDEWDR